MRKTYILMPALALTAILAIAPLPAAEKSKIEGHWSGKIETPGKPLAVEIDLKASPEGKFSGDISIPAQRTKDLPLGHFSLQGNEISFRIEGVPGNPTFKGKISNQGERIEGTFAQGAGTFDFHLERAASPADAARNALQGFDEFMAQAIQKWNVPGMALAVVAGGEVVFAQGVGLRDLEQNLAMTPDSLFAIGSTTKAFTATVLGMLSDQGKLEWDEPLRSYIPWFRLHDPIASQSLTPRDTVTHRSGLPRHDMVWYNNNHSTRRELVESLAHLPSSAQLRTRYQYNNLMFLTAGYLVETLTGDSWEDAVRQRIFQPLGMRRSNFSVEDSKKDPDHALPYRENDQDKLQRIPFRRIDLIGPAGSINSSVNEMSRWLLFNLAGGKWRGKQLIERATLQDIHSPHMITGARQTRPEIVPGAYGMGWSISTYRGHRRIQHGGGIDGFITTVALFPDDDVGLVAFNNRGAGLPNVLANHAIDKVLGLEAIDWLGESLKERQQGKKAEQESEAKKESVRRPGTSPSHAIQEYSGDYRHPGYGELSVHLKEGALSIYYNGIVTPLEHWHYEVFNGLKADDPTFEDMKFHFRSDVNGNIASVEAQFELLLDKPIRFDRQPARKLSEPAYLIGLTGTYQRPGQTIRIELTGNVLHVDIAGQPRFTLQPSLGDRFIIKELPSYSVAFQVDSQGKATSVTFHQPNGIFEAKRIQE